MSKFIKHEFRATARLVLPILLIFVVSALAMSAIQKIPYAPGAIYAVLAMIMVVSLMAIAVIGLIVIISRFYRNTMSNDAYLTMTLPITEHELIWGEIITNILWVLIVSAVLFVTAILVMQISGMMDFLEHPMSTYFTALKMFNEELVENGVSVFGIVSVGIQAVLCAIVAFIAYCMHFYCSMAVGQLFNKHRILMSVLAYIAIRVILIALLGMVSDLLCSYVNISLDSFEKSVDGINLYIGLGNLLLAAEAAILYVPTFLLIGKKINLT